MTVHEKLRRGEELYAEGKVDEAREYFLSIVQNEPDAFEAHNNLAVIAAGKGNYQQASHHLYLCLSINPEYKVGLLNLCDLEQRHDRAVNVRPYLDRYLLRHADDSDILSLRATPEVRGSQLKRLALLSLPPHENRLDAIVRRLRTRYQVETCFEASEQAIVATLDTADIVWLDYAAELAVQATNTYPFLNQKQVICRLHGDEAFRPFVYQMRWENVDDLIFVDQKFRNYVRHRLPSIGERVRRIHVIPGDDTVSLSQIEDILLQAEIDLEQQQPYRLVNNYTGEMYGCSKQCAVCMNPRYEIEDAQFAADYIHPGSKVLDIGAHAGLYSVFAAALVGSEGEVHAFEIERHSFATLSRNAEKYPVIRAHHKAVWDADAQMSVMFSRENPGMHWVRLHDHAEQVASENVVHTVPAVALDSYLPGDFAADFIKLDVEGAELHALRGMEQILRRSDRTGMVIEFVKEHLERQGNSSREVVELLESCGFRCLNYSRDFLIGGIEEGQTIKAHYVKQS